MPRAFAQTGWILGLVAIGILAIMRFVSAFLICLLLSLYKREIGFQLRIRVSYATYLFFFLNRNQGRFAVNCLIHFQPMFQFHTP